MSKGSHEVTESALARLCEWRGLNVMNGAAELAVSLCHKNYL